MHMKAVSDGHSHKYSPEWLVISVFRNAEKYADVTSSVVAVWKPLHILTTAEREKTWTFIRIRRLFIRKKLDEKLEKILVLIESKQYEYKNWIERFVNNFK